MGKEDVCVQSKFGGDRFLAEGSFPRPCFLLGGGHCPPHPSAWVQLSRSQVPALAQLCLWHRDLGGLGTPGTLDLFLIPSFIWAMGSLPETFAALTTFTKRRVFYKMEWKLSLQYGWDKSRLLAQDLSYSTVPANAVSKLPPS